MQKIKVSIFGSCVSREIFNDDPENRFQVKTYFNFNSIVSQSYPIGLTITPELVDHPSHWYEKVIAADFNGNALDIISKDSPDFVIIDLMSERLSLGVTFRDPELPPKFITLHNDLKKCKLFDNIDMNLSDFIPIAHEQLSDYFINKCVNLFCEKLLKIISVTKIIFIESFFCDRYLSKEQKIKSFSDLNRSLQINNRLKKIQNMLLQNLNGCHIIRFPANALADENHSLQLAPMHYTRDIYNMFYTDLRDYCSAMIR